MGMQALLGVVVFGFSSLLLFQFRKISNYQRKLAQARSENEKPAQRMRELELENRTLANQLDATPVNEVDDLTQTNSELRQQMKSLNEQMRQLQASNQQANSHIDSLKGKLDQKICLLLEMQEYKEQLQKEEDLLACRQQTIDTLLEDKKSLQSTIEKLQNEMAASLEEKTQEMSSKLKMAENRAEQFEKQLEPLQDAIKVLNKQLEGVTTEKQEVEAKSREFAENQKQESQTKAFELEQTNQELRTQVEDLQMKVDAWKTFPDECTRLQQALKDLQESYDQEKEKATALQLELEEKEVKTMHKDEKRHLEELQMQVGEYSKKLTELQEEREEVSEGESPELQEARREVEAKQSTISELTRANEALSEAIAHWESKFTMIEKCLMAQADPGEGEKPDIEKLIHKMTQNLHSIQEELRLQHETTEKIQQEHEEAKQRQEQAQQEKDLQLTALDKELVQTRQRYTEIQIQFDKEKETFQERHAQLREALEKIEKLQSELQTPVKLTVSSDLPVAIPESPSIHPTHEEIPISIHDKDEDVEKVLSEVEESEEKVAILSPEDQEKREKLLKQRSHVLKEIYNTEKSYVAILDMVYLEFIVPLQKAIADGEPILTESELRVIFPSWEVIRGYNRLFLEQLKERIDNWEETQCVGDLFIEICIWLKSYSSYINSFDAATQSILEVTKRDNFKRFINTPRAKKALKRQDLSSYLIAPVQRLPRYVLLLKEMVKCTPEDHEDYKPLQQALEGITSIADTVNASKLLHESREMMIGCASRFTQQVSSQLIAPHRTYVCEGIFYRTSQAAESEPESLAVKDIHVLILFSDILVHAKPNESFDIEKYLSSGKPMSSPRPGTAHKHTPQQDLELKKIYKVSAYDMVPAEKHKLGMKIKENGKNSSSAPLKFFAKNEEDKCDWLLIYESTRQGIPGGSERSKRRRSFFGKDK